jgi:hypothetical protein
MAVVIAASALMSIACQDRVFRRSGTWFVLDWLFS